MKVEVNRNWIYRAFVILKVSRYLKTLIIMAKIDLKFLCSSDDNSYIKCEERFGYVNIRIKQSGNISVVCLDKSTAIKLAKTLRTEINKIQ